MFACLPEAIWIENDAKAVNTKNRKRLSLSFVSDSKRFKILPVTELMNIPDDTFVKSTQSRGGRGGHGRPTF